VIVAHANRAFSLAKKAVSGDLPIVAVAHNYNVDRFVHADAVFSITADVRRKLIEVGVDENKVFVIPNMVRCHELPHRNARNQPPVIATMGRFVGKKGFDVFINALSILHDKGHQFKAVIGGGGGEEAELRKLVKTLGLQDRVTFPGWIEHKKEFYKGADIFCLPSLHEPFGIVLLEAFMYGAPVVTSDSEGPRDIITPNYDALMVPKGDATAMAAALAKLINDPRLCEELAANGFAKVKTRYTIETVAQRMEKALNSVVIGL
jgi:glycosyltransferase involved in cell wall biosynthesis